MDLGTVNTCVWGHPSGVDLGNLGEVVDMGDAGSRATDHPLCVRHWIAGRRGRRGSEVGGQRLNVGLVIKRAASEEGRQMFPGLFLT